MPLHEVPHPGQSEVVALSVHQTPWVRKCPPGLVRMETMLGVFTVVLDYRHYPLANESQFSTPRKLQNVYGMKVPIEGIKTRLTVFDGF